MADEQTNPENDPGVEQPPEAEATQAEQAPPAQQTAVSHEHRNQWILFGILVGILIGTVLVIALLRPIIFNRIVPAVMGEFVTPVPASVDETLPAENQTPADEEIPVDEPSNPEEASPQENEVFIPVASGDGSGDSVEGAGNETTEGETAVTPPPAPEPTTHTVQVGDNLTKISQQYGVSVQEIMAANNLTNADYISVGQILVIPTN